MERTLRRTNIVTVLVNEIAKQDAKRETLAEVAGVSKDELGRRLKGGKPIYLDDFAALCHSLNLPVAEVLDRAGVK